VIVEVVLIMMVTIVMMMIVGAVVLVVFVVSVVVKAVVEACGSDNTNPEVGTRFLVGKVELHQSMNIYLL
jgi:hypothetical protein